jgi:hypothetical protein
MPSHDLMTSGGAYTLTSQDREASTLTDAVAQSGIIVLRGLLNATSTHRIVPYVDKYRAATGILQTPAEHVQEAARDEERRGGGLLSEERA